MRPFRITAIALAGRFSALALLALALAVPPPVFAQYPNRTITLVVPFTVGTAVDFMARTLGQRMSERWGQAVVVDNKAGASANIGIQAVAKADPDGHTLLMSATSFVTNAAINKRVPYNPEKSFVPVILIASGTMSLLAANGTPARSVQELVAIARKMPGKLNYGSPGNGTPHHLSMELFKRDSGVDLTHIPYKGTAGVLTDIVGGRLDAAFMPFHVAVPYTQQGSMRMLAVLASERSPILPNVPTMREAGFPNVHVEQWYGMHAPAGTPQDIVAKLNAEINSQLALPAVRDALSKQGLNIIGGPPSRLAELVSSEFARWPRIVAEAGIRAD